MRDPLAQIEVAAVKIFVPFKALAYALNVQSRALHELRRTDPHFPESILQDGHYYLDREACVEWIRRCLLRAYTDHPEEHAQRVLDGQRFKELTNTAVPRMFGLLDEKEGLDRFDDEDPQGSSD